MKASFSSLLSFRRYLAPLFLCLSLLIGACGGPMEGGEANDFQTMDVLEGEWVRPDGGYRLEIREIEENGEVKAAYYNPNTINISKSQAQKEGSRIRLHIEFRDVGYPGSFYDLTYQPESDTLTGRYFQATMSQSYQIEFVRLPASDR